MRTTAFCLATLVVLLSTGTAALACGMYHPRFEPEPEELVARAHRTERAGEERAAIRLYERVANDHDAADAVRVRAALAAGRLLVGADKPDAARQRLELATTLAPRSARVHIAAGEVLLDIDADSAREVFEVAAEHARRKIHRAGAAAGLAAALAGTGDVQAARRQLARARKLGADRASLWVARRAIEAAQRPTVIAVAGQS